MERLVFKPQGVCSRTRTIDYEDGKIVHAEVEGGCRGNLQGICRLIEGMEISEVIKRLDGVQCHNGTSCPDQLAKGLKQLVK